MFSKIRANCRSIKLLLKPTGTNYYWYSLQAERVTRANMELNTPHFSHFSLCQVPGDFQYEICDSKEVQTVSHNLTVCQSLMLSTCFDFWESRNIFMYIFNC
jgi:hypothetical protein